MKLQQEITESLSEGDKALRVLSTGMEWFSESPGGLPRYFADYLDAWRNRGEDVKGLVWTRIPQTISQLPPYVEGVTALTKGRSSVRQCWREKIAVELSQQTFDVWNPHFAYYAWGAVNLSELRDIPTVTHFHGPWAYESRVEHRGILRDVRFVLQKRIEQYVYKGSHRFIVLSEAFKDVLIRDYGIPIGKIHVIPGGVDVRRFREADDRERLRHVLGIPSDATVLVAVRRLVRRMGLMQLLNAIYRIRHDFPNIYLIIVGGGELYTELKAEVHRLRLDNHVRLTNRVPEELLPAYYQVSDISIVPSQYLEGFGLSTIESMACGTPVVGTPIGGTLEILRDFDNNLLFAGTSSEAIADGLGRILGSIHRLPTRKETRDYVVAKYTWHDITARIRDVFTLARESFGE
ncbi:glycosyltransferase family 4 protein [Alicyclobacillus curvatus]|nr:glycosyltransferase family 4 protein [Alicyclobacillus curvatus]